MIKRPRILANAVASLLLGALVALWGITAPESAWSSQSDSRLASLFQELRTAPDGPSAASVEDQIWTIWLDHPGDEVLFLMQDGVSGMNEEDYARALEAFSAVTEIAPDYAEGWNKRANANYLLGDYAAAVADIRRVLMLEPRHFAALAGLGLIYLELDEADGALKAFSAALAINPHLEGVREHIADLQHQLARSTF